MKEITATFAFSLFFASASGQDLVESMANQICDCIGKVESMDSLEKRFDRCIDESITIFFNSDDDDEMEHFSQSDSISNTLDAVVAKFTQYCPGIKELILSEKESKYYKMSASDEARKFYDAGTKAFKSNDYKTAEKQYLKAIKADPGFVFAYDNLGLTYRNLKDYKKALYYYGKSLDLFPEGSMALQNQAVVWLLLNDTEKALNNYYKLINLYPDNPEGYFGMAKTLYMQGEYDTALDYAFYSYKMYAASKSEYIKDSQNLISLIHDKLKEQNKLDIFDRKAKDFGLTAE